MPTEIRMPRLVDSMTEGAVVAWRAREGEPVAAGEVIAEIEVDKTTVDLKAPEAGTLARIVAPAGSEKIEVGAVLAILEPGGQPTAATIEAPAARSPGPADGEAARLDQPIARGPKPPRA